jgi:hypothetical protein
MLQLNSPHVRHNSGRDSDIKGWYTWSLKPSLGWKPYGIIYGDLVGQGMSTDRHVT